MGCPTVHIFTTWPLCPHVCAYQAFAHNMTEKARAKEHVKEKSKEKDKEKKVQQKKKKVNDLERAGQKSGAPAFANKQVTAEKCVEQIRIKERLIHCSLTWKA